jgi:hypothetical protein
VKILLDECIDWRLSRALIGHDVKGARQMSWNAIKNGELLALASKHFDIFLTVDMNLVFQQNIRELPIPVVVLQAPTNRLVDLLPLVPKLLESLDSARYRVITVIS